ncbi:lytic polysaccharide monooxygenase [Cylindrobasidium torrendii FP15055 ss-10]|uniref:lytic cellulose monooxygenase (C4-dehydrogenating) n=1 Tax=Cylindrobasidium torrendii FP15055 ss-10 TaxID=1314674 RepID=A0A0D7BNK0_9AGAR|nr:lytic polysaccharide monooxygenase [Cylindrobasidium torrendii FP15055 ss-10]
MKSFSLIAALSLVSSVWAHGYVDRVQVNGVDYQGTIPGGGGDSGVVRIVQSTDPIKGATNPDITCGKGAYAVADLVEANAGDSIGFNWNAGDGSPWPHNTGGQMNYMADCGGDCSDFDASSARWFKISQEKGDNGQWMQTKLQAGEMAWSKIPENLASGQYLLRHELLSLHLASEQGGAEFYPSCIQVKVGGSGSGYPSDDELVSFPGAYDDSDPGILVADAYNLDAYKFPGPKVASLAGDSPSGQGSSGSYSESATPTGSSYGSTPTSNNGSSGSSSDSGSCKLSNSKKIKKRTARLNGNATNYEKRTDMLYRPRHISRVMRGVSLSS